MSSPPFGGSNEMPAVFPDWSPYQDLDSAARAYLRDPEVALDALFGLLRGASSLRVVPLSTVTEVGCRRRLTRTAIGQARVDSIDVYLLLSSIDDAVPPPGMEEEGRAALRHDALRFGKTLDDGGP